MSKYKYRPIAEDPTKAGSTDQLGWQIIQYDRERIDNLKEPANNTEAPVVSLPTPFARLEIFNNAFERYKLKGTGTTYFDGLISQCLDVWELLFCWDRNKALCQLLDWDQKSELEALEKSTWVGHRLFAKSLKLFLSSDKFTGHKFTFLLYEKNVFAASSPLTGFFTIATVKDMNTKLFDSDGTQGKLFNGGIRHLHNRSEMFKEYLAKYWFYRKQIRKSDDLFLNYIHQELHKTTLWKHIEHDNNIEKDFYVEYPIKVADKNSNITLEFFIKDNQIKIDHQSTDLLLKFSTNDKDVEQAGLPLDVLVLSERLNDSFKYVNRPWNRIEDKVTSFVNDFEKDQGWKLRELPTLGIKFPFIVVNDFIEEYLLEVDYPIDNQCFYVGTYENQDGNVNKNGYLLPLKPLFFKYFKPEDIKTFENKEAGKPFIKYFITKSSGISFSLFLPVGNGGKWVELKRTYTESSPPKTIDEVRGPSKVEQRKQEYFGSIIKVGFSILIFPFVKAKEHKFNNNYYVGLTDSDSEMNFILDFWNRGEKIGTEELIGKPLAKKETRYFEESTGFDVYQIQNSAFDYIQVIANYGDSTQKYVGVIIPNWNIYESVTTTNTYAIDFGTTNTNIAFKTEKEPTPAEFSFNEADRLVVSLNKVAPSHFLSDDRNIKQTMKAVVAEQMINHAFFFAPPSIGKSNTNFFSFPTRSALLEKDAIKHQGNEPFQDSNFFMGFETIFDTSKVLKGQSTYTNLKWSTDNKNPNRIGSFFEQLLLLVKAHAMLVKPSDLNKIKLVRFVPNSLKVRHRNDLEIRLKKAFEKVFGYKPSEEQVLVLSESVAPYYVNKERIPANDPCVCIDIGGGTTDLLVVVQKKGGQELDLYADSFYFAGNALYGDYYKFLNPSNSGKSNGLYKAVINWLESISTLDEKFLKSLKIRLEQASATSEDILSFLFTNDHKLKLSDELKQGELGKRFRVAFVYHFAAISYYIGAYCKHNKIEPPKSLIVSGKGSLYLKFISENLSGFVTKVFKYFLSKGQANDSYFENSKVRIFDCDRPKEQTAEGGLKLQANDSGHGEPIKGHISTYAGIETKDSTVDSLLDKFSSKRESFSDSMFVEFLSSFESSIKDLNFKNELETSFTLKDFQALKARFIENEFDDITRCLSTLGKDDEVNQSLFFYPVYASLDKLLSYLDNPETLDA